MLKNLFQPKNDKPVEPIFPEDNFGILKLEIDNFLALASINQAYNNYPNKKFFPWFAQILFELQDKNDNGHPTNEEAEVLNDLEDKINIFFKENHVVHFIGRLTRNGYRNIFFYLDNPSFDQDKTNTFFDEISAIRPMDFYLKEDKKWNKVSAFID